MLKDFLLIMILLDLVQKIQDFENISLLIVDNVADLFSFEYWLALGKLQDHRGDLPYFLKQIVSVHLHLSGCDLERYRNKKRIFEGL